MNPRMKSATVSTGLALAGLLAVGVSLAGPRPMGRPHDGDGGPMMSLLSQIDLSDDQKSQIKAILDDEHGKMAPLREGSRKAHHALADAVHAPAFDEGAVRAATAQAAGVEADLAVERARLASRVRSVLKPDQQKQLDALRQQFFDRMQERAGRHRAAWGDEPSEPEDGD